MRNYCKIDLDRCIKKLKQLKRSHPVVEPVLEILTGGLGGNGGSFIPNPGLVTGWPITLSMLESVLKGGRSSWSESAEDGGDSPLPSLPLISECSEVFRLNIGSLYLKIIFIHFGNYFSKEMSNYILLIGGSFSAELTPELLKSV